jgi:hypothetical protein
MLWLDRMTMMLMMMLMEVHWSCLSRLVLACCGVVHASCAVNDARGPHYCTAGTQDDLHHSCGWWFVRCISCVVCSLAPVPVFCFAVKELWHGLFEWLVNLTQL